MTRKQMNPQKRTRLDFDLFFEAVHERATLVVLEGPGHGLVVARDGFVEAILLEHGHQAFLTKLADPFWFQSFGAVIGMDWNSSGVTTIVMRALKSTINPNAKQLGLYVCGGKGKHSLKTPAE